MEQANSETAPLEQAPKQRQPLRLTWSTLFNLFCALVFLGMVGLVFFNAFLRYVYRSSFQPSEEWSRFLFIYIIYFGAIEACFRKKHIAVDLLVGRLRGLSRRCVEVFADILSALALILLVHGGCRIVALTYDINSVATDVNMAIINCTLPIMAFAILILTLRDLYRHLTAPLS